MCTLTRSFWRIDRRHPARCRSVWRVRAFTIVELLVVIAIVGVLMSLLFPALQGIRESARRTTCKNHLRQLGLASLSYAEANQDKLPAAWRTNRTAIWQNFSWRVAFLPYLEQGSAYEKLSMEKLPLADNNLAIARMSITEFECPSTPQSPRRLPTIGYGGQEITECMAAASDYAAVFEVRIPTRSFPAPGAWNGGVDLETTDEHAPSATDSRSATQRSRAASRVLIRDGLSTTALIVEQAGKPDVHGWKPTSPTAAPTEGAWATAEMGTIQGDGINRDNWSEPFGFHRAAQVTMCDGSVQSWQEGMDSQVLRALLTRDGKEIVGDSDWK